MHTSSTTLMQVAVSRRESFTDGPHTRYFSDITPVYDPRLPLGPSYSGTRFDFTRSEVGQVTTGKASLAGFEVSTDIILRDAIDKSSYSPSTARTY